MNNFQGLLGGSQQPGLLGGQPQQNTQDLMRQYLMQLFMRRYQPQQQQMQQQPGMVGAQMGPGGMQYRAPTIPQAPNNRPQAPMPQMQQQGMVQVPSYFGGGMWNPTGGDYAG